MHFASSFRGREDDDDGLDLITSPNDSINSVRSARPLAYSLIPLWADDDLTEQTGH